MIPPHVLLSMRDKLEARFLFEEGIYAFRVGDYDYFDRLNNVKDNTYYSYFKNAAELLADNKVDKKSRLFIYNQLRAQYKQLQESTHLSPEEQGYYIAETLVKYMNKNKIINGEMLVWYAMELVISHGMLCDPQKACQHILFHAIHSTPVKHPHRAVLEEALGYVLHTQPAEEAVTCSQIVLEKLSKIWDGIVSVLGALCRFIKGLFYYNPKPVEQKPIKHPLTEPIPYVGLGRNSLFAIAETVPPTPVTNPNSPSHTMPDGFHAGQDDKKYDAATLQQLCFLH